MNFSSQQFPPVNVQEQFNMRKLIYENRDLFFEIGNGSETIQDALDSGVKEELDAIQLHVERGRHMLFTEIVNYRALLEKRIALDEFEKNTKRNCSECQNSLEVVKQCFVDNGLETQTLQNHIDTVVYELNNVIELANQNIENNNGAIDSDLNKSTGILQRLSGTYHTLRNSVLGHVCPVCLSNEVEVYCTPCGHTFCARCIANCKHCCMCRIKVDRVNKIYFA